MTSTTAPTTDQVTLRFFEVGGAVRDLLLGLHTKDVDFTVVITGLAPGQDPFQVMVDHLVAQGFTLHVLTPHKLTATCGVPAGHPLRERSKDADFVLARRESGFTDGRRPDHVEPGSLEDDLARRDFTMNAVAKDPETGALIDPHGGVADLRAGVLRFVGNGEDRVREDGLRPLRGLRFMVMKGVEPTAETWAAMTGDVAVGMLNAPRVKLPDGRSSGVSNEMLRKELERMFVHDTLATFDLLARLPEAMRLALLGRKGLRLSATMKS